MTKTERADATRALYRTAVELDNETLIEAFATRVDQATTVMLASAPEMAPKALESINLTLVTVIFGAVRNAFERNLDQMAIANLREQLMLMCAAYLEAVENR